MPWRIRGGREIRWWGCGVCEEDWVTDNEIYELRHRCRELDKALERALDENERLRGQSNNDRAALRVAKSELTRLNERLEEAVDARYGFRLGELEDAIKRLRSVRDSLIRAHENEMDSAQRAEARIEATLELHQPVRNLSGQVYCGRCRDKAYPCPTVKALRGEK